MAAGGFREFVPGETLDEDKINDFLMQGILVFAGTAARGSAITAPVEGQFAFLKDDDALTFYDGTQWAELASGLGFATISTTATGSYTDGGISYDYWDFTSNGSLVISEGGLVDVLVVGGGGGRGVTGSNNGWGGGGGVRYGIFEVTAGTVTVTIGAGGSGAGSGSYGGQGTGSSFGSYLFAGGGNPGFGNNTVVNAQRQPVGGGGQPGAIAMGLGNVPGAGARGLLDGGSNNFDGITLNYNNSSIEYGMGGSAAAATNSGGGGSGANAEDGRVVVRVRT